jgi:hypothetical protein
MFDRDVPTDRGQAYTLEGFIGAMVVLMAVLFALQSVVIMPTTGGLSDQSVQAQLQQETRDALVVATSDDDLSAVVRNWNDSGGFENATRPAAPGEGTETYSPEQFAIESELGRILEQRFAESGWTYNVELHPDRGDTRTLVYQGSPPSSALSASYIVTLYDDQPVTSPSVDKELHETNSIERMLPRRDGETPIYNVVEVRVIVW